MERGRGCECCIPFFVIRGWSGWIGRGAVWIDLIGGLA